MTVSIGRVLLFAQISSLQGQNGDMVALQANRSGRRVLAAIAVGLAVADAAWYLGLIAQQSGGGQAEWFLAGLCVAILLGVYGTLRTAPRQGAALALAGTVLFALGVLGILSVGWPLIVAGFLCWLAAVRDIA